jgi:hypothetical protein
MWKSQDFDYAIKNESPSRNEGYIRAQQRLEN